MIRACRELSDLFLAVGAPDKAALWQTTATNLTGQVRATFWDAQTGLFLAATQQCVQPDIWGSAFAVYLGVATPDQSIAIASYFKNHYAEIVQHGQLRELPGGMYWQNMGGPRDTYQNGGYWATPMGWFIYTLDLVDHQMADRTVLDMVQNFYVSGVHEDIFGDMGWNADYNSSAALPLAGIKAMLQRREINGS
jgi:neutral trehalase